MEDCLLKIGKFIIIKWLSISYIFFIFKKVLSDLMLIRDDRLQQ